MGFTVITSAAGHHRIARGRDWLKARARAEEILIVGATLGAANEFARRVAQEKRVSFGYHRLTFGQLASALARPVLAAQRMPELLPAATSVEFANQIRLILPFLSQSALVNLIEQRVHMPHVGPVLEGRTFFCPHCGAFYSATPSIAPRSEGDAARCVVCLKIMDGLDVGSFKLIHRPEDA